MHAGGTGDLVLGGVFDSDWESIRCSRRFLCCLEHAKDADLFICEGMYGEPEKKAKAVEYKHMTFYEAAEMAKKACVKEMWLTHYSPSLVRPEPYMEEVRKIFATASAGKDGKSTTLLFEEE
jgi:ribonuclease Z